MRVVMSCNAEDFNYVEMCALFSLDIPEDLKFAFDVLAKAADELDNTALILID